MRTFITLCILLFCTAMRAQEDRTFVLMGDGDRYSNQTWFYSGAGNELQESKIKEYWNQNKYITSVAYTKNGWFVAMSKEPDYTRQTYNYTRTFPSAWIKEKYNTGYYITAITCNTHKWLVVMSKYKPYTAQAYKQGTLTELSKWYDENRSKGYFVTQATYSDDGWLWVTTKGTDIETQGYRWAKDNNIGSVIKGIWDEGYCIHMVEYGGGQYFIPFGKYKAGDRAQSYKTSSEGMSDWISQNWEKGNNLQYIGGGNPTSASSSATTSTTTSTTTTTQSGKPQSWRQDLPGGGYTNYTRNADGSYQVITVQPCIWCKGRKICSICNGMGGVYGRAYGGMWYTCKSCAGTKVCQNCRGQGQTTMVSTVRDGISIGYDQNGRMYTGGGGTTGSGSGSGRSSRSSGTCPDCGGKGYRRQAYTYAAGSSMAPYHNTGGSTCYICNAVTDHYHYRCTTCKRH